MSGIITVDSNNFVNNPETALDKLRASIGKYYKKNQDNSYAYDSISDDIVQLYGSRLNSDDQTILPRKKHVLSLKSEDNNFDSHEEWRQYCFGLVSEGAIYFDHAHIKPTIEIQKHLQKEYHRPDYEDLTKIYSTEELLNYNLINYPNKLDAKNVGLIGDRKTIYDANDFEFKTSQHLEKAFSQFETRLLNYSGSRSELKEKQRNIFSLHSDGGLYRPEQFPFFYNIDFTAQRNTAFDNIVNDAQKTKIIFQKIKNKISESTVSFRTGEESSNLIAHNITSIITNQMIGSFSEADDELFLLPKQENSNNPVVNRFVNQITTLEFFSTMRSFLKDKLRDYVDTSINPKPSHAFHIGFKIEKSINNATSNPIQTYYTTDSRFIDTQIKYGTKYFYKIYNLYAIIGSSYTYSNLIMSNEQGEMTNINGQIGNATIENGNKYRAELEVSVSPSFQVIEELVDNDQIAFVDTPTLPPQVMIYGRKHEQSVNFFFRPNFFKIESVFSEKDEELGRALETPFLQSDERIIDLLQNYSRDLSLRGDYFAGKYEIYRMNRPPNTYLDFADHFLQSVDVSTMLVNQGREPHEQITPPKKPTIGTITKSNQNAHFEDKIMPNKKYYYLFRAVTHHGTPSNTTITYEIELQKDSDEYKLVVNHYKYPDNEVEKNYNMLFKRLINLQINPERLNFNFPEDKDPSSDNWSLNDGSLFFHNQEKSIKLRVTSKHTGKKVDLNLKFKLIKNDSFNRG